MNQERFVSKPIDPLLNGEDAIMGDGGEPVLPRRFGWNDHIHEVDAVLDRWRTYGACRHGSGEQYLRRHWFKVRTADGATMTLYFDRQPRRQGKKNQRWWLYTLSEPAG